jgi:dTDP-4-dehydrorhamnose 3,5-epimerase
MKVTSTSLPNVLIIEPTIFKDKRGFFVETYHQRRYQKSDIHGIFVQDNFSHSVQGVLRGLHYQLHHPQEKLVQVMHGAIFDVAVDIRQGSPTFG